MTDSCIICQTEPIDDLDWYRCEKTTEVICPFCVDDMIKSRERQNEQNIL